MHYDCLQNESRYSVNITHLRTPLTLNISPYPQLIFSYVVSLYHSTRAFVSNPDLQSLQYSFQSMDYPNGLAHPARK